MKFTIETEDVCVLGYAKAVLMGYLRENPTFERIWKISDTLGVSEDTLRKYFSELEHDGYIRKVHAESKIATLRGRNLVAVEVLK